MTWWQRWRRQRRCFHGQPATARDTWTGQSFVRSIGHLDWGRKLWECREADGGCGKRWVL